MSANFDPKALFSLSYGLYLVTSHDGQRDNGMIANTACQQTDSPCRVSVTINKANYSHDVIRKTGKMNVHCLSKDTPFAAALLVLSLLITPAAAALLVTSSPRLVVFLSVVFALASSVGGILLALGGRIPISPYVTTVSFAIYLVCRIIRRTRGGHRRRELSANTATAAA